jgi:tyrosine-protein kinase Etk/Wzc
VTEINDQTLNGDSSSLLDVIQIIRLLLRKKKLIFITTSIVSIAAVIASLLLPESFKSTSIILPETDKSKLASLGGLSDLASLAGVGPGEISPIKLFPAILKSESVLKSVIYKKYQTNRFKDSVNLIQFDEIKTKSAQLDYETALISLRENLDVAMDIKTSIITLTIETGDPRLSADIINSITGELDLFMRTKRSTNAMRQRQWIEARLGEVKQDLVISENRIKDFRENNRSVSTSPLLLLEQERLLRDVQINAALYMELKKQFELSKIEEIKNTPIVNIMDYATPAAKKNKPKRGVIVISAFFLSILGASGFVYIRHAHGKSIMETLARLNKTI